MTDATSRLVRGLSLENYHDDRQAVSRSMLVDMLKSPAHCFARNFDPNRPPRPAPTDAMILGTMVHCATLEPNDFYKRYAIAPKCDRRTKAGKQDWADFCSSLAPGQEAADEETAAQAQAMGEAVRRVQPVNDLLRFGEAEVSAYWTDIDTGVPCRVRPDWIAPAGEGCILVDLKTTTDASPEAFARTIVNFGYDFQAAYYTDGWQSAASQEVHGFVIVAVEKEYPFAAVPYMLTEDDLQKARRRYKRALKAFAECRASGRWPGYVQGEEIPFITLPAWANKED